VKFLESECWIAVEVLHSLATIYGKVVRQVCYIPLVPKGEPRVRTRVEESALVWDLGFSAAPWPLEGIAVVRRIVMVVLVVPPLELGPVCLSSGGLEEVVPIVRQHRIKVIKNHDDEKFYSLSQ
jgi:hypothetical protein